jgi:hypothetical protein
MHARIYRKHEAQGPSNKEEGFRGDRCVYNLKLFESFLSESRITVMANMSLLPQDRPNIAVLIL